MAMKQLELRDTLTFKRGRDFEQEIARQMILSGCHVQRCYLLSDDTQHIKAPMLEGPFKGLRLPDLQAAKLGKTAWYECKEKTDATYTHSLHEFDHGIGLPCYRDYVAVQEISGLPVILMVGEFNTGQILWQSLTQLGQPRLYTGDKMGPGGMAFWPRDRFDKWGDYDTMPGQPDMFGQRRRTIHRDTEPRANPA